MGNKLIPASNYHEKLLKFLQSSCDEGELKARILDLSHLKLSEEDFLSSLLPTDIRFFLDSSPRNMKFLLHFLTDSLFLLSSQRARFEEEKYNVIVLILKILARILPILYEVFPLFRVFWVFLCWIFIMFFLGCFF